MKALIPCCVLLLAAACGGGEGGGAAGTTGASGAAVATGGTLASGGTGAATTGGLGGGGTGTIGTPTGGTSGGTNAGGVGVSPGDAGMPVGDAGMATCMFEPGAMPSGACENTSDCMLIESGEVDKEADRCGNACVLNGADCTVKCMTDAIDVSPECARCFADIVQCAALNCAGSCFLDSNGMPCRMCVDTMCTPAFDACTGRM